VIVVNITAWYGLKGLEIGILKPKAFKNAIADLGYLIIACHRFDDQA
jgi:hypothetical protein